MLSDKAFKSFEDPIRSEIFSAGRLEAHGVSLAQAQKVTADSRRGKKILPRVADNARILEKSYRILLRAISEKRAITPAAEWLIDNFHIVRTQLKDIHDHLPSEFYNELPKLEEGPLAGFPRVYGIAWAFVSHTDSRFDPELLKRFLLSYQSVQPLTIGELWAVSITIRVVMMENLRRLSARIIGSQLARHEADNIANELLGLSEVKSRSVQKIIGSLSERPFLAAFAVQLLQRLRFQDAHVDPVLVWLEQRLEQSSISSDEIVSIEHSSQTSANATVRNIITSSRLMSAFNWLDFFEEVSLADKVMKRHHLYGEMDFSTRNRYRQALEELSRYSNLTEIEVAEKIITKVQQASCGNEPGASARASEPGYYLISSGRFTLEKEIGFQPTWKLRLRRFYVNYATPIYLGVIIFLTLAILAYPVHLAFAANLTFIFVFLLTLIGSFSASDIAIAVLNRLTIAFLGPRHLPRLNLEKGVSEHLKTFVVVPTLISDPEKVEMQLEQLEIHYLSNPESNLYFALLSDWPDSNMENQEKDQSLLEVAKRKLQALNDKYPYVHNDSVTENAETQCKRFYMFHRRRLFNPQEGKWMGWERKRGKLHEFNCLLLGHKNLSFIPIADQPITWPENIRYVITLDADTRMPNGTAVQLVGTMAHPLNTPRLDEATNRVVGGYGILQPRITPALPATLDCTLYQRLSTGNAGIDPYASAVSDVYQDLFGEGSFTGKGIYDVRIFEKSLEGRIPENTLLSHDLFEGNHARCGFLSDVEFFEDFPSHTEVAVARAHRWTRGDWQLLPWLLGRGGESISILGRWKMFDNLRRSLVAPMSFLIICLSFLLPHWQMLPWLSLTLLSLATPALITFLIELIPMRRNLSIFYHLWSVFEDLQEALSRYLMQLSFLPHQTWMTLNAIIRAMYRLFVSHRKMLEWTTAAQVQASANLRIESFFKGLRGGLLVSFVFTILIFLFNDSVWPEALPLLMIWWAAPLIAYKLSTPPKPRLIKPLQAKNIRFLHLTGRRIWHFFDTFVTAEDHFLPPDNFQEEPHPVVAHRSSPTNFGLYLLSAISARDFGWIGTVDLVRRLSETLHSVNLLPRYEGHFFNWYETREKRALDPKYISSVDNGNLAGHLLAVGSACLEALQKPLPIQNFSSGLWDCFHLFEISLDSIKQSIPIELKLKIEEMRATLTFWPASEVASFSQQQDLREMAQRLVTMVKDFEVIHKSEAAAESLLWVECLQRDIDSALNDYTHLYAWAQFKERIIAQTLGEQESKSWTTIQEFLGRMPCLKDLPGHCEILLHEVTHFKLQLSQNHEDLILLNSLLEVLEESLFRAQKLVESLIGLHGLCHKIFHEMDFGMLYDPVRKLFSIGFRVADQELDVSYYDLMASEARLTSFIAIAKGDVPVAHWFRLGRALTKAGKGTVLVSWSGSMFEYLMPSLVMVNPEGSLMEQTCRLAVRRQIQYGFERNVPWGMSESAYNKRDLELTYQYSNFGVPDLALKRGLAADLVVAPYATLLAAMFESSAAAENLRKLQNIGALGRYGFYEAIDFTSSRLPEGKSFAIVKCYMAHHQGMSLVSIGNLFKHGVMRTRFHAEPLVQAAELLLQERMPRNVRITKPDDESFQIGLVKEETEHVSRTYHAVNRPVPTTQLLSNGEYSVMMTSSGSGYSRFKELAVTRWREDVTCDNWGSYFYIRDIKKDNVWSATYQPTCVQADHYEVTFFEERVRFTREDGLFRSQLEVFISPEDNAEIRRLTITNNSDLEQELEITSYCEVVLNSQGADLAHPAFSNLFVQTEYDPDLKTLLATRRPRSAKESPVWAALLVVPDKYAEGDVQYETDRQRFFGRGNGLCDARAVYQEGLLSNTVGAVLDPIFSLRIKIRLPAGASSQIMFATLIANGRAEVINLADKFHDPGTYERVTGLAWTQAQVKLHYLNMEPDEAHLFQRLATRLFFLDSSLRPSGEIIKRNSRDVTNLWALSISGDHPIVLVRIDDFEDRGIVRQLLKAHEYLGAKGLVHDLVILNEKANSYSQDLQNSLQALVHSSTVTSPSHQARGKVFTLRSDQLSIDQRLLLFASSRVTLSSRQGSLSEQVRRLRMTSEVPILHNLKEINSRNNPLRLLPTPELKFFNGQGGFSLDGLEYVVVLNQNENTPAPWINVIANSEFGFQVSESGAGYTWASNSRENQITPWLNDPVSDPSGESFYIFDKESGALWSPTARPIRIADATYLAFHGQGYSRFEHLSFGIHSALLQFVAWDQPIKISTLTLENRTASPRELSVCGYIEWVLGFSRSTMALSTVTEMDDKSGAIFATNSRSNEYGQRVSFFCLLSGAESFTGDRTEFLGRNGHIQNPAGLHREQGFSGRVGAALDPCAALQKNIVIEPNQKIEISFALGQVESRKAAQEIIDRFKKKNLKDVLQQAKNHWEDILTQVQVETPDPAMDIMLNRWLLYQTLVCRFWARAGFYQAGGAFGFRDQLQDVMALVPSQPKIARAHILRAAARQFVEGDVQHWWHPPLGRGVRTHFSDDLLWLPYVVFHYLGVTQDITILNERISFLEGPLLRADQEDSYYTPNVSHNDSDLYDHCVRALDRSLATGAHGLPLIGSGDWNDGMNRVGHLGKGESVWLAWFLYTNLLQFSEIARSRGDVVHAEKWEQHAKDLQRAVEKEAWDGAWYRRAYFDDGTPIGSASQVECKIDSLAQTWAIISKAADPVRSKMAMQALEKYLVRDDEGMILLFTPAFDHTPEDPGYIKGYLPGVRENGGQYTHAAVWCIIAYAMMDNGQRATDLFSKLNPINHALTAEAREKYKVEPYVIAADVYSQIPYTGRGGWTWYTGSCGWMYRAGIEYILGIRQQGNELFLNPQVPPTWKHFSVRYRFGRSVYIIRFENPYGLASKVIKISIDGVEIGQLDRILLQDDEKSHEVHVQLGKNLLTSSQMGENNEPIRP